ncbi:MAG: tetratricopeptide repeat protein, partial [Bacteroidota bacterium]
MLAKKGLGYPEAVPVYISSQILHLRQLHIVLIFFTFLSAHATVAQSVASRFLKDGFQALENAQYDKCRQLLNQVRASLPRDESSSTRDSSDLLEADLWYEEGKINEAQALYYKLLEKTDDPVFRAQLFNNIGACHYRQGDYFAALQQHLQSLTLRRQIYQGEHPDLADSYNNIGNCHFVLGDLSKALEYHLQALAMRQQLYQEDHLDVSISLMNTGNCYFQIGQLTEALQLHEAALEMREGLFGREHPRTASVLNALAKDHVAFGRFDRATDLLQEALQIRVQHFGVDAWQLFKSYESLGDLYAQMAVDEEAIRSYRMARKIFLKHQTAAHPLNGYLLDKIGLSYQSLQLFAEARLRHEAAAELLSQFSNGGHPHLSVVYNHLGNTYVKEGAFDKALDQYRLGLNFSLRRKNSNPVVEATLENNIGLCMMEKKRWAAAEEYFIAALEKKKNHPAYLK